MKPLTRNVPVKEKLPQGKIEQTQKPAEAKPPQQAQCCAKLSKSVAGCHD